MTGDPGSAAEPTAGPVARFESGSEVGPVAGPVTQFADTPEGPSERHPLRSVLLAGGGSAGHVSPLLACADALRRRYPQVRITALGTESGLEARLVPSRGYDLAFVSKVPMPRRPNADLARLPGRLRGAVTTARRAILECHAQVVVGFGGYVSTPAYLAARSLGVPIVIHEQNSVPGLANRTGARLTRFVATTFPMTRLPHARVIGMPLRPEISQLDRLALRAEATSTFGLDPRYPTVLVTGGSLGARRINQAFAASAAMLSAAGVQVLHVTGRGKEFVPESGGSESGGSGSGVATGRGAPYIVVPYADRMELAYAAADLVVCRAGANTVCELSAVGLAGVYVPLPIGNGEQRLNATDVVEGGGGLIVDDGVMSAEWVREVLLPLMGDEDRIAAMGAAAARRGQRHADESLADIVEEAFASTGKGTSR